MNHPAKKSGQSLGDRRLRSILQTTHEFTIAIWLSRNSALHNLDDSTLAEIRSSEFAEISHNHNRPHLLPQHDQHYCSRSLLERLLASSASTWRRWLRTVQRSISEHDRDGARQSLLTSFFTPILIGDFIFMHSLCSMHIYILPSYQVLRSMTYRYSYIYHSDNTAPVRTVHRTTRYGHWCNQLLEMGAQTERQPSRQNTHAQIPNNKIRQHLELQWNSCVIIWVVEGTSTQESTKCSKALSRAASTSETD